MKVTAEQLGKVDWSKCNRIAPGLRLKRIGNEVAMVDESGSALAVRTSEGSWIWALQISGKPLDACLNVVGGAKAADAFIASEIAAIEMAEKRERTKPEPGDGFEYCSRDVAESFCFWNGAVWLNWSKYTGNDSSVFPDYHFAFRRPKKSAPKLPTVKAPDGCWWESDPRYGMRLAWSESPGCTSYKYVPRDAATAERGKAVNAAFDEANGSRFVQIEDFIRSTTTYRPIHYPPPAWVHHVKLGNGIEFDVGEPHRFKCGSRVRITIEELPETPKPA